MYGELQMHLPGWLVSHTPRLLQVSALLHLVHAETTPPVKLGK
jgi:hypothetical protein